MSYAQTHLSPTLELFEDYDPFEDETPEVDSNGEAYSQAPKFAVSMGNIIQFPNTPTEAPTARILEDRWYQTEALEEIDRRMPIGAKRRGGKGEMLVSPTGCGKTSIASRAIKKWLDNRERVLILTDLDRLLEQMRDDLMEEQISPIIEKAEHSALKDFGRNRHANCVLASMQTLHDRRLQNWPKDSFDKIVIDEAHELKWLNIVNHFGAPYLGLTATPIRADRQSLKDFFHYPYIRTLTMREAIEGWDGIKREDGSKTYVDPFLCRIRLETIPAHEIDLTKIRIVGKDFDQRELDREIWGHTNYLASAIVKYAKDRPSFTFCPKVQTAIAIAKAMRDIGADAMDYTSETPDPKEVMKRFVKGDIQHLVSVNMLIKGVNVPKVSAIFRVRASLNIGQATQEIGRGTRNHKASGKQDCIIYEFEYKTGNRKLASVIDAILDGADDPDAIEQPDRVEEREKVRERAESIIKEKKEDGDDDVIKAYDKAQLQITFEMAEARRKRQEERQAKYKEVEVAAVSSKYDPFAGLNKEGSSVSQARTVEPATPEQMAKLEELTGGIIKACHSKQWNAGSAEQRIKDLEIRAKFKFATEKQLKMMIDTLGCDPKQAHKMKKWEASGWINERKAELCMELEPHGFEYQKTMEMAPWEIANLHRKHCPIVPQEMTS